MSGSRAEAAEPAGAGVGTRKLDHCLACGGGDLEQLALEYRYQGARYPLMACRRCGMRFLGVQPVGAALAALYAEPYFEADFRCGRSASSSFDERAFVDENRGLLDAFERLTPPGRLLEVGCASGWLLQHAARRGWNALGVELSPAAVGFARSLGVEVIEGDLLAASLPDAAFDLVYMGDVLEHVPDCRAVLTEVARVLAPGGHLYLRGPITTHSLARSLALGVYRLGGRRIVLEEPPYHLWEFTPDPLRRLVSAAGLQVIRLVETKIPPGRPHGRKSGLERWAMAAIDAFNLAWTRATGTRGDRVTLIARRPVR